jgi:Uma2 family endonuclease
MPVVSTTKMTAEQFLMLGEDPPGVKLELVDGEIAVSPSPVPDHSTVVMQLAILLGTYINEHNLGEIHHDVDTILDRFTVRRPDILFYSTARAHLIGKKAMEGPPDLAVEVISPSSVEIDRQDKFAEYQAAGVAHYWIVDPQKRTIDAWHLVNGQYAPSGSGKETDVLRLPPFAELDIPLSRLWRWKAS